MVTSLIYHERIVTTTPKAKELKRLAEWMIGFGKDGSLHARRQADAILREKPALTKLFEVLGPRYAERDGGYTRVLQLAKPRTGDNAPMSIIEYVDRPGEIRAAKPPASKQKSVLADVLSEVGIEKIDVSVVDK
eukprot:CAMPEP_0116014324 /NCGR_PEP_ID=MMETSP0321-20121206/6213_1 /TAXON_ID=163516 /ORGANISM="Leptocylindrus danicus var. danicus, Strain B650" /LENGTH=133 /DNA_ID=CAMNT_0003483961 /DNA_START=78 /DNA_END=479 /DNA_ORIENTATION=+